MPAHSSQSHSKDDELPRSTEPLAVCGEKKKEVITACTLLIHSSRLFSSAAASSSLLSSWPVITNAVGASGLNHVALGDRRRRR